MNNEEFNNAMCRLRQAEGDFNKAFQDVYSAISKAHLKNSGTEAQAQIDEAYNKGLKDLQEAFHIIFAEDEMSLSDLYDTFDTCSVCDIILRLTPEEIIDKTLEWKTKQKKEEKEDQELHIGDEIEYMRPGREPEKCIVIGLVNGIGDEKIIWTIGLDLFQRTWFSSASYYGDSYRKTGKHYDAIPFPKEIR